MVVHRKSTSQTNPGINLKRLLQQPSVDRFPAEGGQGQHCVIAWPGVAWRLFDHDPHGYWCRLTLLAALRRTHRRTLPRRPDRWREFHRPGGAGVGPDPSRQGGVVGMDDLASQKLGSRTGRVVRAAIRRAAVHLIFLPPHGPDLNSIEQVFAKFKHFLREAAKRTIDTATAPLADILDRFTPRKCTCCLFNAGHDTIPLSCTRPGSVRPVRAATSDAARACRV